MEPSEELHSLLLSHSRYSAIIITFFP